MNQSDLAISLGCRFSPQFVGHDFKALSNAKVTKRGEDFYVTSSSVKSVDEGYEYVNRLLKIQEKEQEEYKLWFAKAIKSREVAKLVNDENSFPKLN